jgi:hypothetical protein
VVGKAEEAWVAYHNAGPENYSVTDPGPARAPITKWLHARLDQVKQQTEAGAVGWHKLLTRPVTSTSKQPLKAQRDKLRRTHPALAGWRFRVLTANEEGQTVHVLWAHYDAEGGSSITTVAAAARPASATPGGSLPEPVRPLEGPGEDEEPPARPLASQAPPSASQAPPHPQALMGMDWANDDDEMPLKEVEE